MATVTPSYPNSSTSEIAARSIASRVSRRLRFTQRFPRSIRPHLLVSPLHRSSRRMCQSVYRVRANLRPTLVIVRFCEPSAQPTDRRFSLARRPSPRFHRFSVYRMCSNLFKIIVTIILMLLYLSPAKWSARPTAIDAGVCRSQESTAFGCQQPDRSPPKGPAARSHGNTLVKIETERSTKHENIRHGSTRARVESWRLCCSSSVQKTFRSSAACSVAVSKNCAGAWKRD